MFGLDTVYTQNKNMQSQPTKEEKFIDAVCFIP